MELINTSPFVVQTLVVIEPGGRETLLVIVKGSYDVGGGVVRLSAEQDAIRLADDYSGEPGVSSIRYAGEGALFKPATDVLLVGQAYVPRRPAGQVDVVLKAGTLAKTVRVFGDRRWEQGLFGTRPSAPALFDRMPLVYERSFGGMDKTVSEAEASNPVGVGFRGIESKLPIAGTLLPNLENPAHLVSKPTDRMPPAGFGAIAAHWQPRLAYAGTYGEQWKAERAPSLPDDYDPRFQQVAPLDQVYPGYMAGGEPFEVLGAAPGGRLFFQLPKPGIKGAVRMGEDRSEIQMRLDTVVIDGEHERIAMTWRGSASIHDRVYDVEWIKVSAEEST